MDSQYVEHLAQQMREQYPDLVKVIGEYQAQNEVSAHLAALVINYVLDPVDADEIYARATAELDIQYKPFQHDIDDTRTGFDENGDYHRVWHGYTDEYIAYLRRGR
jgi:hypothetical protein